MHEREGARLGLDYAYRLLDFDELGLADAALGAVVAAAEELGFAGLNVTHPFKQSVVAAPRRACRRRPRRSARSTRSCSRTAGAIGHNTDCWGFAESFRESMAGCGARSRCCSSAPAAAGAAVAHALLDLGVGAARHLSTRDPSRADAAGRNACTRASAARVARRRRRSGAAVGAPTGWSTRRRSAWRSIPGMPFARRCAAAATSGSPTSSISRPRRNCCARPRAAGCRTLPGTRHGDLPGGAERSSCSPACTPDARRDGAALRGCGHDGSRSSASRLT